jgi:hypothetical protein
MIDPKNLPKGESTEAVPNPKPDFGIRDRTAFFELIELAESTFAGVQKVRFNSVTTRFVQIASLLLLIFAVAGLGASLLDLIPLMKEKQASATNVLRLVFLDSWFIIPFGFSSVMYVASRSLLIAYERALQREYAGFREVMSIVNEVFESVRQDMSPIEQAQARIRLSRLDN